MSNARRTRRKGVSEINVVPYIDVMLVLLVIFLVTAPLIQQGVQVNLPQAQSLPLPGKNEIPFIITVDKQGDFYFNKGTQPQLPLKSNALVTEVAAQLQWQHEQGKTSSVFVRGDKEVPYGKVIGAMTLLQKAGVSDVGLMTDPSVNKVG